jgi:phosphoribosylaminoimidazolecarboxamide formyltransferase / IMP cyclohydrolase
VGTDRVARALLSVFDKRGILELARGLSDLGIEILSSGGTADMLVEGGIPVVPVSTHTGFPEMLDGRVKTLHPRIHAGILAVRANERHAADLRAHGIPPIDLVVVNLYPFERTVAKDGVALHEAIEMIDIGGPAMVRAAAKNHADVGVIVEPEDYAAVLEELRRADGRLSDDLRLRLASKAFQHTSAYDAAVHAYLATVEARSSGAPAFPDRLVLDLRKVQDLRYGENPHQRAAFYRDPLISGTSLATARQLQGKELSFNNLLDCDAALTLAAELPAPACAIIKHGNPCGVALGPEPRVAFDRAFECDPTSAFGGVLGFNTALDRRVAEALAERFFECVVAPSYDDEAREVLERKKALRLLETGDLARVRPGLDLRKVTGGLLVQDADRLTESVREARVVSRRAPTEDEWRALEFAWIVAKNVKSNAIVYAVADRTLGIGAGQMSRVDSARIAAQKARAPLDGAAMASDAFFPFRDGIDAAAGVGIRAVVEPGGSVRDDEVIAAADEHGMALVFTGRRHFRH